MVFSSNIFVFWFLPLALLFYYLAPGNKAKNGVLLFFSLLFYFWGEQALVLLMIISCLTNYGVGLWIAQKKQKVLALTTGLLVNLGILAYYKYFTFFLRNLNKALPESNQLDLIHIALPIGISFFTFQGISYLIDVYREDVKVQRNPVNLALYISMFPQLVAGPIVRYQTVAEAVTNRIHSMELFKSGVIRFVIGLAKKLLIANVMAQLADEVMNTHPQNLDMATAWLGLIAYTLQIYFDFSGYSDMAIGLGRMFGFKFLENFNFPYIARSIQDFWRRWHISLSTWFRDYLYIPLGGNRKGSSRTYFNLIVVFLLTGLWHGASWGFVVWGLFHGAFLIIERLGFKKIIEKFKLIGNIYTLLVVMVGWVFFRVEGMWNALEYLKTMFVGTNVQLDFVPTNEQIIILILGVFFALNGISLFVKFNAKFIRIERFKVSSELLQTAGVLALFLYCIMVLSSNAYNPFIYFRF